MNTVLRYLDFLLKRVWHPLKTVGKVMIGAGLGLRMAGGVVGCGLEVEDLKRPSVPEIRVEEMSQCP